MAIGAALAAGLAVPLAMAVEPLSPKIGLDLEAIDDDGLTGPPAGRRSVDYEFCVPDVPALLARVQTIDPSVRVYRGSHGRVGCGPSEALVIGNTHQPDWREVLRRLAALPYVRRIVQAHFE
jgi:hypothetical protein